MDEIDYRDRGVWPIGPDGSGATLAKLDKDTASGDPGSWRASAEVGGTPGGPNFPEAAGPVPETVVLPIAANWRYNESGVALAADWASSAHAVGSGGWQEGPALLGFETSPAELPEPLRTSFADPVENEIVTYYFETDFELSGAEVANLD
ncbi:MAG: hypothetical protein GWO24_23090, partial [Akkermansiaceae bacterium]|nr:hypothetical protein [Akkermansiaceae bacterium]